MSECFNSFTGDYMVTVSDINSIFSLKIYSKIGISIKKPNSLNYRRTTIKASSTYREALKNRTYCNLAINMAVQF